MNVSYMSGLTGSLSFFKLLCASACRFSRTFSKQFSSLKFSCRERPDHQNQYRQQIPHPFLFEQEDVSQYFGQVTHTWAYSWSSFRLPSSRMWSGQPICSLMAMACNIEQQNSQLLSSLFYTFKMLMYMVCLFAPLCLYLLSCLLLRLVIHPVQLLKCLHVRFLDLTDEVTDLSTQRVNKSTYTHP